MLDLRALLKYAADEQASDVHICVGVSPRIRVHGKLRATNFPKMTSSDTLEVFLGIVTPEQRERFDKAGELDMSVSIPQSGRYRVNAYKQRGSISLAFRLVDMVIPDANALMIPECVMKLCKRERGLVVVSGPAGSGKSTLLAALIDDINTNRECNIVTLEDPVEYLHQHKQSMVNQREIGLDTESYSKGLAAALREDPDVIQVGTLANSDTASKAIMAAQTGRLVFTSMYTAGIVETLEAMTSLYPRFQQDQARCNIASCLSAIVTRQLCEGTDQGKRVPAYGILLVNKTVRKLIKAGNYDGVLEVVKKSRSSGMITMDDSLIELALGRSITPFSAIANAQDPEYVAKTIQNQADMGDV